MHLSRVRHAVPGDGEAAPVDRVAIPGIVASAVNVRGEDLLAAVPLRRSLLVGVMGSIGGSEWAMTLVGAGFLAAYTTFSTWMFEAARLIQRGAVSAAIAHVGGTIMAGLVAAGAGLMRGAALGRSLSVAWRRRYAHEDEQRVQPPSVD